MLHKKPARNALKGKEPTRNMYANCKAQRQAKTRRSKCCAVVSAGSNLLRLLPGKLLTCTPAVASA